MPLQGDLDAAGRERDLAFPVGRCLPRADTVMKRRKRAIGNRVSRRFLRPMDRSVSFLPLKGMAEAAEMRHHTQVSSVIKDAHGRLSGFPVSSHRRLSAGACQPVPANPRFVAVQDQ
jgi:hypothetical protein